MKSTTVTAAFEADIFYDDWGLQTSLTPGLTPGFKLEPSSAREFPAFLERASPLPATKTTWEISP
ncbi:MAG: hypothetical protein LBB26_02000 [Puniceicoccales bacterium]|jgi:hypothetical protein|nr:hypothetical protein [Puniceicoccales bacterium]